MVRISFKVLKGRCHIQLGIIEFLECGVNTGMILILGIYRILMNINNHKIQTTILLFVAKMKNLFISLKPPFVEECMLI